MKTHRLIALTAAVLVTALVARFLCDGVIGVSPEQSGVVAAQAP